MTPGRLQSDAPVVNEPEGSRMRRTSIVAAAAVALAALVAGCGGSTKNVASAPPSTSPPQLLQVVAHAHSITAPGAAALRPGLVELHVRNASSIPHGIGVIALGRTSPDRAAKIVGGDTIPERLPFALLGGVPQLQPGQSWTGTVSLVPGRYLLFDDGENQKGMRFTFTVAKQAAVTATPPKTVGTITMTDFKFGIHLPANWNGSGVVKVPNLGKEIHELTFVTAKPAELRQLQSELAKGYPQGGPPKGARITFAVGGMSPGHTTYVRLHLPKGRYLAICLFPDSKTGKPHTALGMMSTVTVH
jgi:hypothetical protein